ncbi:GGDEF domain-containing protein [Lapillicoccus sp.]|uniref:GGDEF domain-containing protein n=1 Tax=Lapillicoccus sp. TaxID=1909287 RepID=UPI0025D6DC51|nr:GGDEF domain-containing protein [Lapillicoccus sp.]
MGTASWALGEAAWSYYELIAGRQTPFPSFADAGYLLFPVLAAIGLLIWPSAVLQGTTRWRTLLDGALVAGALLILSWVTALGSTVHAGGATTFGYVVSLGYPLSDLVLLTLTVVIVTHARQAQSALAMVAVGLACLCVADTGFAYLTAEGTYETGSPVDAGWFGGFLLIAVAAYQGAAPTREDPIGSRLRLESTARALLPYLPAGIGLAVALTVEFTGHGDHVTLAAAAFVIAALLGRQLLAVLDNRALVRQVLAAQHELRYQAFHDPLTGLANRLMFGDRLRHSLELHQRDLRPLSVLYCDLDGFKDVNDTLGHDAGDIVLKSAAERLNAVTRTGDTTARIGGDEFAILLEDGGDPHEVAVRIFAAFAQPVSVGHDVVPLTTSIGIAELTPDQATPTAEAMLQRADRAMYAAKRAGKGTVMTWTGQPTPAHQPRSRPAPSNGDAPSPTWGGGG